MTGRCLNTKCPFPRKWSCPAVHDCKGLHRAIEIPVPMPSGVTEHFGFTLKEAELAVEALQAGIKSYKKEHGE